MLMPARRVRPAMAAAATIGAGRKPSAEPWCSLTTIESKPTRSAHSAMSRVALCNSAGVAGPHDGARMSNRMKVSTGRRW